MHPLRFDHMPALGEEFRSAREARGLTLSDVAEQIHIRSVYLNAIENEDWTAIGAPVYVRGFIRTYARFLGLDAEDAVAMFNRYAPVERAVAAVPLPSSSDDRGGSGPSLWVVIGGLVAVLLVGFVGYEYWQYLQGNTTREPVATATAQPGPAGDGSPSASPNLSPSAVAVAATPFPHHQLDIHLTQRSWLRVTVDGTTQLEGIFPAGTTRTFNGSVADLRVGNAGGVVATVDGRPTRPLGKEGDVAEQRYTL